MSSLVAECPNLAAPSWASSSCPAWTVTVCATFQSAASKTSVPGVADRSASPSVRVTVTVTVSDGLVSSTTSQDAVPPSGAVTLVSDTPTPGVSSSFSVRSSSAATG